MDDLAAITNSKIAEMLYEIVDLLEIKGVKFKPEAYRRAAQAVESLSIDIKDIYRRHELDKIPGIGKSIASKISEIIETGQLQYLEELREELPSGLRELLMVEGLGPKKAMKLYQKLKISNIDELESAAKEGRIRGMEGFGEKTELNLLENIKLYRNAKKRRLLGEVLPLAKEIENSLRDFKFVKKVDLAGSIRRRKETIGDIDILVASEKPLEVIDFFVKLPFVKRILSKGTTKSTVVLNNNMEADLRVLAEDSYGAGLLYFTGSKDHNIKVRDLALSKNWKLSEYDLKYRRNDKIIAAKSELEIYKALKLDYIEPELRENRGEIEAAQKRELPKLVKLEEIRGDLHVHTKWSDGLYSIEDMAKAAGQLKYEYIAICDHTKTLQVARGINEEDIKKQIAEIEKINRKLEDITILSGTEVNIGADGKLDIRNDVLRDLDIVVASVHSGFKQSEKEMTERVLNAIHNDNIDVLGHPTGRILNTREPYQIDLSKIFEVASKLNVLMEINAFLNRLDLSDLDCIKAKEYNVKFSLGTDAHNKDHLRYMELGIAVARRGWLEKKDVINTLKINELKKFLE